MIGGFGKFVAVSHARALALRSAPVQKGSIAPFDRLGVADALGGEKLRQPYKCSVWVQRAIKKVAGPITAVSLQFTNAKQLISDPDLQRFWRAPAVGLSFSDFVEANVIWQKLAGETFWLLDDTWLTDSYGGSKLPFPEVGRSKWNPFIVARPDRMRHVVKNGVLAGWEFTDKNRKRHVLLPEQVIHCKSYNPYDEWRGLAEMEAAAVAAESDYLAGNYSLNVMRNNGDRGPYIVAKAGIPDQDQQKQLIEQLREKRELNQRGIFKPFFVSGDISVEDPKAQSVDAAFLAARLSDRHEVFIAFGVPPSMADKTESYSVGSASDWYMLIIDTCMPLGAKICGCIDLVTRRMAPSGAANASREITASFNWMEHPVMKAVRKESLESGTKLWATGMPWEAINEFLELNMPEFKGWEKGFLPFSVATVAEIETQKEPSVDPARNENATDDGMKPLGEIGAQADLEFLRKVWLGFMADGTVNDVMANLTSIRQLTEMVGLPVNTEYDEPYLPVRDDLGGMVTGDVVRDDEGDVVGGTSTLAEPEPDNNAGDENRVEEPQDKPPVSEPTKPDEKGHPASEPVYSEAVKKLFAAFQERVLERRKQEGAAGEPAVKSPLSPGEKNRWRQLMAKRRPIEKAYWRRFHSALFAAREEVIVKLKRSQIQKVLNASGVVARAAAADFMFSLDQFTKGILTGFRKEAARALQLSGQQLMEEIGKDDPWSVPPKEVKDFVASRENRLSGVAQNVFDDVKAELQAGLDGGETMQELADRIRGTFSEIDGERAMRIAMTETSAAYGVGRQEAMKSAGITQKKWLTSGNDNVRPAHAAANGQTVGIDEDFTVGGEQLAHPGDPDGSPGNVINCHCVSIAVAVADEE